ncbi:dTDP-4-dehydrorhamnose reductase [Litorisediminicola beolgyonensis]|uniref:dTDP-4-dehydrorhamnose reductase n=1 Tax=Litorisediminicola beolgyonensis TaxID=1173614 RepID=A0ABW3ZP87_9RHOB
MKLLVFGKSGQVARELAIVSQRNMGVFSFLDRHLADFSFPDPCAKHVLETDADVVINAAAWTAVDAAESDEAAAHVVNAETPGALARACAARDLPFLHISTDYVFDGSGDRPWREDDPVAPRNAYGRTKLAGEEAVRAAGGRHLILRTSWVVSAHGANFVKTMLRLSETRDALSVVDDQVGGPTPARAIAEALVEAAGAMVAGQGGGTYHFAGQPPVSWAGFATEIFAQSGREVAVTGIPTAEYPTPAERPLNSRLDCAKLRADFGISPPDWTAGLNEILQELGQRRT